MTIFVFLVLGIVGRRVGLLSIFWSGVLSKLAFYVALPALVFLSVYARAFREIFSLSLLLVYVLVIFSMAGLGWLVFRGVQDDSKRSISVVQTYHGNLGYIGLPVVLVFLGEAAAGKASILLGLGAPVHILFTMILLVSINEARTGIIEQIKRVFLNPILLTLLIGIIFSILSLPIPNIADKILSLVSKTALPLALLGAGSSIEFGKTGKNWILLGSVLGLKLLVMPIIGFLFLLIFGVTGLTLRTGVLMLGMPTAISTYVYARELGGDEKLASWNITFSTMLSLATIPIIILLLV